MSGTDNGQPAPDSLLPRLGAAVRRARVERRLTMKELAALAGLSVRFVAQLEAGEANIAIGRLAAIAGALGMRIADLVDGDAGRAGARGAIDSLLAGRSEPELAACLKVLEMALGADRSVAVALLGLRGAGKSTIGPRVARALDVPFVELDERIEEEAGLGLAEIFALHGEAYYRRLESRCLASLLAEGTPRVIALPGGIVNSEEAFDLTLKHCTTVWLKARPEDHMERVLRQGDRRPVADRPNAMAELRAILAAREPLYAQADVTIDTSRQGLDGAVRVVVAALERKGWVVAAR